MRAEPRTHPLLPLAVALLLGIWLGDVLRPPAEWLLPGAALIGALCLWRAGRTARPPAWGLALCMFLLGAGLLARAQAWQPPPNHVLHQADGRPREIIALVTGALEPTAAGRGRAFQARVLSLDGLPASGLARFSLDRSLAAPPVGSRFSARAGLLPFVNFANPGGFDYVGYMAEQGLWVRAWLGKKSRLTVLEPDPGGEGWWLAAQYARQRVGGVLDALQPGQGGALLRALVLGQRGGLSPETRQAFSAIGAAHLLAISGLHLGLVLGMAYFLLKLLPAAIPWLARRPGYAKFSLLAALLPAVGYAALAGWSTPTLRSLLMAACLGAALLAGRPYRPEGGLALAALLIGLIWPQAVLGLSFQLSFVAVASILWAMGYWSRAGWGQSLPRWTSAPLGWLLVSLVVGLAIWPLVGHSFHQLPLYSVPANAVLIPLVGLVALPLGLAAAGLSLVWTQAGEALFALASWPAEGAVRASHWLAGLPGGVIYLAGPNLATVLLLYAGAASAWLLRGKVRRLAVGLATAGALSCIVWQVIPVAPDGKLRAWVLDVGQGSAAVLRTPGGKVMLVDGGGLSGQTFDTGARVVAPFLWWAGWSRPWIIVGSHREQDHVGGLCFVLRHLGAHQLWVNGGPNGRRAFDRLWNQAQAGGTPIKGPADLPRDTELAGARVRLFWPPPDGAPDRHDENDRSLWLGVGLGDTWIWLPGDVGPSVERLVAPRLPAGGEHVLITPHHGSGGSLTPELLDRIKPAWVIISVACHNRHHLPHPDTVARARAAGCRVLSTAQWGALELVSDGAHWSVQPWQGEARDCPRRP